MDCNSYQGTIQGLHDSKVIGETHANLAAEHFYTCDICKRWFKQNMCPKMQNENDEDIIIMHYFIHETIGDECPHIKD